MKIVSFSGIDGAGKTTQISAFDSWLKQVGQRTTQLAFWDDIVVFPRFREFLSHKAFKGDQGVGSPDQPLVRRDKNVTSRPVIAMRFCLYFGDAVNLWLKIRRLKKTNWDVVIFDRYIYDELANLPLNHWMSRLFVRLVTSFIPKPDVAYVIDADPEAAFARKPEYPLEFLRSNRNAYLTLGRLTGNVTIIEPLPIEAAAKKIREAFLSQFSNADTRLFELPATH